MATMRYRNRKGDGEGGDPRRAILLAAQELLEERDLDDLTVVDLIQRAGVSRATFYLYFESKHAVVAALTEAITDRVYAEVWRGWFAGVEPADRDVLIEHMRKTAAVWQKYRAVVVATAQGWRTQADAYAAWGELMDSYIADLQSYIERASDAGLAHPGIDPRALATALVWGNESTLYLAASGKAGDLDGDRLAVTLADIWWRSIFRDSNIG